MKGPQEVREPVTNTLIGCLVFPEDRVKYVPIHPMVAAAFRLFREKMNAPYEEVEPQWEEMSESEDLELSKLDGIDNILFLKRQAI